MRSGDSGCRSSTVLATGVICCAKIDADEAFAIAVPTAAGSTVVLPMSPLLPTLSCEDVMRRANSDVAVKPSPLLIVTHILVLLLLVTWTATLIAVVAAVYALFSVAFVLTYTAEFVPACCLPLCACVCVDAGSAAVLCGWCD